MMWLGAITLKIELGKHSKTSGKPPFTIEGFPSSKSIFNLQKPPRTNRLNKI